MKDTPFRIENQACQAMLEHFREELPREGCGFLAGSGGIAHRYYRINNINPSLRRFSMDPLHVRRTEKSILMRRQRILGVCHSHPEGRCYPSRWDIEGAFFDADLRLPFWVNEVQVIVQLEDPAHPVIRGFQIQPGGDVREVPITVLENGVCIFSTSP